jgi:hypothetical protein
MKTLYQSLLLALGALALGSAHADQTHVDYNLAAGATSAPIYVPAANTPISVTCSQNANGFRGIGQATLLRIGPPSFLEWVGIDIATGAISTGSTATLGTHIIWCSFTVNQVDIQVESDTAIQLHNASSSTAVGVINFVW